MQPVLIHFVPAKSKPKMGHPPPYLAPGVVLFKHNLKLCVQILNLQALHKQGSSFVCMAPLKQTRNPALLHDFEEKMQAVQ